MKTAYETAIAKLELFRLNNSRKFRHMDIPRIPNEWTEAEGSEGNMHIAIPNVDNYTSCMYIGKKGSLFPPHKHVNSSEHFTILNEGGKIEVITRSGKDIIEFPNSCYIEPNKIHALKFLTETKILCLWTPAFNNDEISIDFTD
jgi:quercetin dioxygenase-like cupin family protein